MKIHQNLNELPDFRNAVITIGSFDGVHLGHQKIIKKVNALALKYDGESVVITFHPHPRQVIYPKSNSLKLLTLLDEKIALFKNYGVDHLVIVPFSIEFSQQSAQEYLEAFLFKRFNPVAIIIGYDHRFGLNRQGDITMLRNFAENKSIQVVEIAQKEIEEITISSTKIRNALLNGALEEANLFLGHQYMLSGEVVYGDQIGKSLGFPTANIEIKDTIKLLPTDGVYAVTVSLDNNEYGGMMYIGERPTINNEKKKVIEINLFGFDENIYGSFLKVKISSYIRGDIKFKSKEALSKQLEKDRNAALTVLNQNVIPIQNTHYNLAIAILNYNGRDHLEAFLPAITNACPPDGEIIIIDNASDDDSIEFLEEWFPEIKIIQLSRNFGFADGYNRGLEQINHKHTFILNSDVLVEENSIVELLKTCSEDQSIAAVQPIIRSLETKKSFEYAGAAGGMMDSLGYPFCRGRIFDHLEQDEHQYPTGEIMWASGAAMMVNTSLFKKLGGFDPTYFAHMEEIDWCMRALRAGYKIICQDDIKVFHLGGGTLNYSNPRKTYLNFRNNLTTLLKHNQASTFSFKFGIRICLDSIAGFKFLLSGEWNQSMAILKAYWSFFSRWFSILDRKSQEETWIKESSIGESKLKYEIKSILWNYYILRNKTYSSLK